MASKRLRAVNANSGDELKLDMSPMIDMVFLLLIFFIVNANLIVVKMDKDVEVPVAKHSSKQEKALGRIVVNVYGDDKESEGRIRDENGTKPFLDDAALLEYIQVAADNMRSGVTPQLHLRGHRNVEFKHCRRVIRVAAQAGVDQVVFASYANTSQYTN